MQTGALERIAHLCALARTRIAGGDWDGARSYLLAARAAAGDAPPPEMLRLLASLTAELHDFDSGIGLMEQALDGFRLAEQRAGEVATAAVGLHCAQRRGNLGRARTLIEWALAHVDADDQVQRARLLNIAATVATFQGRLENALALVAEAQPLATGRVASWIALNTAVPLSHQGRHTDAQQALLRAEATRPTDDIYTLLMLHYARAWCMLVQDDYATARAICEEALHRMAPEQHPIVYYPTVATLGVLARESGDLCGAEALLTQALVPLQARKDRAATIGIYWHQALLAQACGDDQAAEAGLRTALSAMQADGYGITLLWQPRRFVELCTWGIEREVEVTHMTWLLRTSLATWTTERHCGATASAERPADPVSRTVPSWATLTIREQEVLRLAAEGLHDQEIAARLNVSVRTVQNHLRHCYDKLGVRTRTAAVRVVLDRHPLEIE